jgi:3-deoxy-D-manno-octulosonic-acid transferase
MPVLYNLGIIAYTAGAHVVGIWSDKARKWVAGRKNIFNHIEETLPAKNKKRLWMHVASLGEFEQGLPLIEKFNRDEWEVVTTFFSPSGYEYRQKHPSIDKAFYLPADTAANATRFLDWVQPDVVVFVKYDFWYHYLTQTKQRNIPLYLISALFRPKQPFFSKFNALHRTMLQCFNHVFTQEQGSVELLKTIGYTQATYTGDTRCDRVLNNVANAKNYPLIKSFKGDKKLLVAGSSWPEEENILAEIYSALENKLRLVIAPHNISEAHLTEIENKFAKTLRYSKLTDENAAYYDVVIIDNIGMLSSLYQYADVAFIGGAFRKGLHNVLEAAVFSIPVIYGKPISKYPEGHRLAGAGGGFMINNATEMKTLLTNFITNDATRIQAGQKARHFIDENAGAAQKIFDYIIGDLSVGSER